MVICRKCGQENKMSGMCKRCGFINAEKLTVFRVISEMSIMQKIIAFLMLAAEIYLLVDGILDIVWICNADNLELYANRFFKDMLNPNNYMKDNLTREDVLQNIFTVTLIVMSVMSIFKAFMVFAAFKTVIRFGKWVIVLIIVHFIGYIFCIWAMGAIHYMVYLISMLLHAAILGLTFFYNKYEFVTRLK